MYRLILILSLYFLMSDVQTKEIDPTKPFTYSQQSQKVMAVNTMVLESIMITGMKKIAVINGTSMVEGDSIGEYQLTKIEKAAVVLAKDDETLFLRLYPKVIVKQ